MASPSNHISDTKCQPFPTTCHKFLNIFPTPQATIGLHSFSVEHRLATRAILWNSCLIIFLPTWFIHVGIRQCIRQNIESYIKRHYGAKAGIHICNISKCLYIFLNCEVEVIVKHTKHHPFSTKILCGLKLGIGVTHSVSLERC